MSTSLRRTRVALTILGAILAVVVLLLALVVFRVSDAAGAKSYPQLTQPPATVAVPTVAFVGDSYSSGAGSTGFNARFTTLVSAYEGWSQQNFAFGGTGYLRFATTNKRSGCAQATCPNYQGVIDNVKASDPNIVVVSGGRNDVGLPPSQVATAINSFYTRLREAVPDARIIVTSPLWAETPPPAQLSEISQDVRAQATRIGATYLDLGEPLVEDRSLVSTDGVHPNNAGHAEIAHLMEVALSQVSPSSPASELPATPSTSPSTRAG